MKNYVLDELIFMTLAGSHMYGTSIEGSDIDKRGVCVPPKVVVNGFARTFNQQQFADEDTVIYSLQKFMQLAADCNPNVIELLFAPKDCVQTTHPTWERLLERRDMFLTAKAYFKFTGYAHSQLKRIKGHRTWLMNPPTHKPTREEFGLTESGQGVRELAKGIDVTEISPEAAQIIGKERQYKAALKQWNDFQKWKEERNPARAALEAEHGLDTKHAMHLIRLLRMGKQILTEGKLDVRRDDAEELLSIRNGAWSYDQLVDEAERLDNEMKAVYDSKSYVVPHHCDVEAISDFCIELHDYHWANHAKSVEDK